MTQLLQFGLPFLGVLVGGWLASRFSAIRAHDEKVWIRKADAYGRILEALSDIRDWYAVYLEDIYKGREATADQETERQQMFREAQRNRPWC